MLVLGCINHFVRGSFKVVFLHQYVQMRVNLSFLYVILKCSLHEMFSQLNYYLCYRTLSVRLYSYFCVFHNISFVRWKPTGLKWKALLQLIQLSTWNCKKVVPSDNWCYTQAISVKITLGDKSFAAKSSANKSWTKLIISMWDVLIVRIVVSKALHTRGRTTHVSWRSHPWPVWCNVSLSFLHQRDSL